MQALAQLYLALDATRSISRKQALMVDHFRAAPAEDAAWSLWLLLGHRLKRLIGAAELRAIVSARTGFSPAIIEASYAQVGDLAETIALLTDDGQPRSPSTDGLALWIARLLALANADDAQRAAVLHDAWARLPFAERLLLTKLLTGGLRVGVSKGLAAKALAAAFDRPESTLAARLAGDWRPSAEAFRTLVAEDDTERPASQPYPFALAAALDADPDTLGACTDWQAEWKWDGIRAQLIHRQGQVFIWSRGEELMHGRFPELEQAAAALPDGTVLDGEILAWNEHGVMPFAALQTRIGRKKPGAKLLASTPVIFMVYDLLEHAHIDQRHLPLWQRGAPLHALLAHRGPRLQTSAVVEAADWSALMAARATAREQGVEGLMLKHRDSPYHLGRKRGQWWKWKCDPRSLDAVLVYAQAGHGRRATLYTDYTLAVWKGDSLVPIAKAYSGLTDAELVAVDQWIRRHTLDRFGPVRQVVPELVFEIAFEGIQASPRHKSGLALRFPRIHRWRQDKTADQADTLETASLML